MTGEDLEKYLKKLANEVGEKANECCHRSDGYKEEVISVALEALKKAVKPGQWISLKEQEPPKGESILITDGNVRAVASWKKRYSDGTPIWELEGIGGYDVEADWEDHEITHWMASPELPGKEKNS